MSLTISALAVLQLLYCVLARTQMVHMTVRCQNYSCGYYHCRLPTQTTGTATQATFMARKYSSADGILQFQVVRRPCIDHLTSEELSVTYDCIIDDLRRST